MKAFLIQTILHMKRLFLRKPTSVFFSYIFPLFFYILYTRIFVMSIPEEALKIWNIDYMISMIIYGVLLTAIANTAGTLFEDQMNQFDLFLELSPTPKMHYYLSIIVIYIPFYLILIGSLGGIAYILNDIQLNLMQWIGLIIITMIGLIPFASLGILISLAGNSTAINVLSNLVTFPLAILGGLWWPLDIMPEWIQVIGRKLPTYIIADMCRFWVHERIFQWDGLVHLILWSLLFFGMIAMIKSLKKRRETLLI